MNPLKNLSCPGCGYEIPISLAASARHLSHKCPNCHSRELHEFVAPAELDDDDPMWLADSQIDGLFEGFCGPEDHRGIIHFLRCTGLSESVVKRVHEAICLYRPAAQEKQMPSGYALIAAARKHVLGHATFYLRPVQSTPVELTDDEKAARRLLSELTDSPAAQPVEHGLPERDPSLPDEQQGLFRKFEVRRTDGSDAPGGKHHGCDHFVLDVTHDPHALPAMIAYANSVKDTHPALAADMRHRYRLPEVAEPVASIEVRDGVMVRCNLPHGFTGPLYTTPQAAAPARPLSEEKVARLFDSERMRWARSGAPAHESELVTSFAHAVIAEFCRVNGISISQGGQ